MKKIKFILLFVLASFVGSAQIFVVPVDTLKKYQFRQYAYGAGLNFADYTRAQQLYQMTRGIPVTGTVTVAPATSYTYTATYTRVSVSGTGTITAGAYMVSVANVGDADATFNGVTIEAGTTATLPVSYPNKYPQITYDCLTSRLEILVTR